MAAQAVNSNDLNSYLESLSVPEQTPAPQAAAPSNPNDLYKYLSSLSPTETENYNPAAGPATLQFGPFDTGIKIPGWLNRGLAGAGKYPVDLLRGIGERVGLESPQDIANIRQLEAPLMATAAGKVGNVVGGIATTLPAMLVPGANTVAGGAALGGALGLAQPTAPGESALKNVLIGGATGGAGSAIGGKIADWAASSQASRQATADILARLNAERDATLQEGRAAGYVVPPTAANPNLINTGLESVAGKAATRQAAETSNQKVTNSLVSKDLGLDETQPITRSSLQAARSQAGKVYQQLKDIGSIESDQPFVDDLQRILASGSELEKAYPGIGAQANQQVQDLIKSVSVDTHDGGSAVELTKLLRNRASSNFKAAFRTGDPEKLELARAQQGVSNAVEDLIGRHLEATGNPELAQAWQDARTTIAKSYQAQAALKGGNVSALRLASQMEAGKPMTGGMGLAARFGSHFGEVARLPKSGVGVSKLAATVGLLGEGGAAYLHSPTLAGAAALTMAAPYATRGAILSELGQRALATPNYEPSALSTAALKSLETFGKRGTLAAPLVLNPYSSLIYGNQ